MTYVQMKDSEQAWSHASKDWVSMMITADETADLTQQSSWHMSNGVGNPAVLETDSLHGLLGVTARNTLDIQEALIGKNPRRKGISEETARYMGFGAMYWLEGVVVRRRDSRGRAEAAVAARTKGGGGAVLGHTGVPTPANDELVVTLRVNNNAMCNLGAVVAFSDKASDGTRLRSPRGRFLRYTFAPGLSVAHPAIVFDQKSDMYWMVSNLNRDSTRRYNGLNSGLKISPSSLCEADRSSLGLFVSPNLIDW